MEKCLKTRVVQKPSKNFIHQRIFSWQILKFHDIHKSKSMKSILDGFCTPCCYSASKNLITRAIPKRVIPGYSKYYIFLLRFRVILGCSEYFFFNSISRDSGLFRIHFWFDFPWFRVIPNIFLIRFRLIPSYSEYIFDLISRDSRLFRTQFWFDFTWFRVIPNTILIRFRLIPSYSEYSFLFDFAWFRFIPNIFLIRFRLIPGYSEYNFDSISRDYGLFRIFF